MTPLLALTIGRDLIDHGWTQGSDARDLNGWPCLGHETQARAWCTTGAVHAATWPLEGEKYDQEELDNLWDSCEAAIRILGKVLGYLDSDCDNVRERLTEWNDHDCRSREQVLALYDMAIRLEQP